MACICCGSDSRELVPIPTHIGNLRACAPCVQKHGLENIAAEADRLLSDWFIDLIPEPQCAVCGGKILLNSDGTHSVWCQECEAKRKAYVNAQARRA